MAERTQGVEALVITPEIASGLLDLLRWHEDMAVVNDFGECVWLGPCFDRKGKRIGITDCCLVANPCPRHAALPAEEKKP